MAQGKNTVNDPPLSQDEAYRGAAEHYGAALMRLARGYDADVELARDLVQDIHAKLWRSFEYFEG